MSDNTKNSNSKVKLAVIFFIFIMSVVSAVSALVSGNATVAGIIGFIVVATIIIGGFGYLIHEVAKDNKAREEYLEKMSIYL